MSESSEPVIPEDFAKMSELHDMAANACELLKAIFSLRLQDISSKKSQHCEIDHIDTFNHRIALKPNNQ